MGTDNPETGVIVIAPEAETAPTVPAPRSTWVRRVAAQVLPVVGAALVAYGREVLLRAADALAERRSDDRQASAAPSPRGGARHRHHGA